MKKLLPCPFCGAKAKRKKSKAFFGTFTVQCKSGHFDGFFYHTASDATAAWNARASTDTK